MGRLILQSAAVDEMRFGNGTTWQVADVMAKLTAATEQADSLVSFGGNDVIDGLGGDDQLFGGAGNDTIAGDDNDNAEKISGGRVERKSKLQRSANGGYPRKQFRQRRLDSLPNHIKVNVKVAMCDSIAHALHVPPAALSRPRRSPRY